MSKFTVSSFFVGTGTKKGFLGLNSPEPGAPNLEEFNAKLAEQCNALDASGYDPVMILPLNIGTPAGNSQIWSITRGAAIVGRKRD